MFDIIIWVVALLVFLLVLPFVLTFWVIALVLAAVVGFWYWLEWYGLVSEAVANFGIFATVIGYWAYSFFAVDKEL